MRTPRLAPTALAILMLASATVGGATLVSAQGQAVVVSGVTVSPEDPTIGETVTIEVTVSNQAGSDRIVDVSSVMIRDTEDHYGRAEDLGSIAPGGSLTVPITTTFEEAGEKHLKAHVSAEPQPSRNRSSVLRPYYRPITIDVEEPDVEGGLSATTNASGETTATLTNYGNVDLTDPAIRASTDGERRARKDTFDVAPDESASATFDTENYDSDTVTFTATYAARGERHEVTRTVDLDRRVAGEIRLTSLEVTGSGSVTSIDGEAANVGGTDVDSVLVSVPDADGVSPAGGSGEYFVGSVDASEFATFELTASVENGTSAIPIEIAYIVDNERVTTTQTLDVSSVDAAGAGSQASPAATSGSSGGPGAPGLPVVPIVVGLLVVVGIGGAVYYLWNRG
jgi:hypothetical protein